MRNEKDEAKRTQVDDIKVEVTKIRHGSSKLTPQKRLDIS